MLRLHLAALLAAAAAVGACSERRPPPSPRPVASVAIAQPAFPDLPTTPDAVTELVRRETARPVGPERDVDATEILATIAARPETIVAGEGPVTRWIQRFLDAAGGDAYVLFGVWHDAPGQVEAFRRLAGPGGLRGLTVVATELFRADGDWGGVPIEVQRGDGAAIDAYVTDGEAEAFAGLTRSHRDADYAAWKLGFEPVVLDLLVNARATGVRFLGCDMPAALQERSGARPGGALLRLREIHCLRSLPPEPRGRPRRAALLWGQAHLQQRGLRRFLSPGTAVLGLHVFGRRLGGGVVETALSKELDVLEPALVPLGEGEAALLLPDAQVGGRIDRVLVAAEPGEAVTPGVTARAEVPGVLVVGERSVEVGREPVAIALREGEHGFVFRGGGRRVVGAVRLEAGHRVELGFDAKGGVTSYVERAPGP